MIPVCSRSVYIVVMILPQFASTMKCLQLSPKMTTTSPFYVFCFCFERSYLIWERSLSHFIISMTMKVSETLLPVVILLSILWESTTRRSILYQRGGVMAH